MTNIETKFRGTINLLEPPIKTYYLYPDKDAMLMEAQEYVNYGDSKLMQVNKSSNGDASAILNFAGISNIPQKVWENFIDATFTVSFNKFKQHDFNLSYYKYDNDRWDEIFVAWANAPEKGSFISTNEILANKFNTSLNVSELVVARKDQEKDNIGFYLKSNDEVSTDSLDIYSRESEYKPVIAIRYYDIPGAPYAKNLFADVVVAAPYTKDLLCTFELESVCVVGEIACTLEVPRFSVMTKTYYNNDEVLYEGTEYDKFVEYDASEDVTKVESDYDINCNMLAVYEAPLSIIEGTVTPWYGSAFDYDIKDKDGEVIYQGNEKDDIAEALNNDNIGSVESTGDLITGNIAVSNYHNADLTAEIEVWFGSAFTYLIKDTNGDTLYNGDNPESINTALSNENVGSVESTGDLITGTITPAIKVYSDIQSVIGVCANFKKDLNCTISIAVKTEDSNNNTINCEIFVNPLVDTEIPAEMEVWKGCAFTHTYYKNDEILYTGDDFYEMRDLERDSSDEITKHISTGDVEASFEAIGLSITDFNGTISVAVQDDSSVGTVNSSIDVAVPNEDIDLDASLVVHALADSAEVNGSIKVDRYYAQTYTITDNTDNVIYTGQAAGDIIDILSDPNNNIAKVESTGDLDANIESIIALDRKSILCNVSVAVPVFPHIFSGGVINCVIETTPGVVEDIECTMTVKQPVGNYVYYDRRGEILANVTSEYDPRVARIDYPENLEIISVDAKIAAKYAKFLDCITAIKAEVYDELPSEATIYGIQTIELESILIIPNTSNSYVFIM